MKFTQIKYIAADTSAHFGSALMPQRKSALMPQPKSALVSAAEKSSKYITAFGLNQNRHLSPVRNILVVRTQPKSAIVIRVEYFGCISFM